MSRSTTARRPSGTPEGGRFAPTEHPEAPVRLDPRDLPLDDADSWAMAVDAQTQHDALCPDCTGYGLDPDAKVGIAICGTCSGSGLTTA